MKTTLFALAALTASPAIANVDASNPARLYDLLRSEGYAVELGRDSVGDPKITAKFEGRTFAVFFYDCTDNVACRTIQLQVAYDMSDGMALVKANEWNRKKRYATVYLDDEMDPFLQMDVNLDYGVSDENFVDNFKMFTRLIGDFEDFIDW
ncbi:YbjN domain-containing protein [Pacificoceanicola onchidii]|uniref:YbjN domain-containing protein n=1 Tax=Pacificoceanicola onchidii TaxID=2562685 RepID=UPI00145601A9|nr:YbjN domain-containing protein [Pacificoceanicola onchidii]